jgi:phosphatidylglycerophosphatase A
MTPTRWIATFGGVGLAPKAPGTWGSLAALPFGYGLHVLGGFPVLVLATLIVFAVGWWATARETEGQDDHDPSEIVIDEVAGQWIALWALSGGLWFAGQPPHIFPWPGLLGGFLLFRLFDIFKPWPVSVFDRMSTPFGVMMDDVVAGILASAVVLVGAALAHGWF